MFVPPELNRAAQLRKIQESLAELAAKAEALRAVIEEVGQMPCSCHATAARPISVPSIVQDERQAENGPDQLLLLAMEKLRMQKARHKFLPSGMLRDLGWNILLDLFVHDLLGKQVSVSSACLSSGGPTTTALRLLDRLEQSGMIGRKPDRQDKRRVYVGLTDDARDGIARWLTHTA